MSKKRPIIVRIFDILQESVKVSKATQRQSDSAFFYIPTSDVGEMKKKYDYYDFEFLTPSILRHFLSVSVRYVSRMRQRHKKISKQPQLVPFQRSVSARSADLCSFEPTFNRSLIDAEACIFFAWFFEKKIQVVKRWTKKNRLTNVRQRQEEWAG